MSIETKLTGDWKKAEKKVTGYLTNLPKAMDRALQQECLDIVNDIKNGIQDQAPGGQSFAPLAQTTLAVRKYRGFAGTKVLQVTNTLKRAVTMKVIKPGEIFVGLLRSAPGKNGQIAANIGAVHEFGSKPITITVTAKMRRFLFGAFRAAGILSEPTPSAEGAPKAAAKVIVVQVPARPFLQPAFNYWHQKNGGIVLRYQKRVEKMMESAA